MASRKKTFIKHIPKIVELINNYLQSLQFKMHNNPANRLHLKNYVLRHINQAVINGEISTEMCDWFNENVSFGTNNNNEIIFNINIQ